MLHFFTEQNYFMKLPDFYPSVLSPEDKNVQSSFLLLTVKDHNLARSNTFIGEALVRLSSVPLVESDAIACQPKTLQLKLTRPGIEAGALQLLGASMAQLLFIGDKIASMLGGGNRIMTKGVNAQGATTRATSDKLSFRKINGNHRKCTHRTCATSDKIFQATRTILSLVTPCAFTP